MISAFFRQPPQLKDPHELVVVMQRGDIVNLPYGHSYPDYVDYRAETTVFSDLAAYMMTPVHLSAGGQTSERTWIEIVSPDCFDLARVSPAFGEFPRPGYSETTGGAPIVVLSYRKVPSRIRVVAAHAASRLGVGICGICAICGRYRPVVAMDEDCGRAATPSTLSRASAPWLKTHPSATVGFSACPDPMPPDSTPPMTSISRLRSDRAPLCALHQTLGRREFVPNRLHGSCLLADSRAVTGATSRSDGWPSVVSFHVGSGRCPARTRTSVVA